MPYHAQYRYENLLNFFLSEKVKVGREFSFVSTKNPTVISFTQEDLTRKIGVDVSHDDVSDILKRL